LLNRVIMHVDLDYFYAQCEENANPSIRGKPVVVCVYSGRTEESGAISTCNYEARRYGVHAGIPIIRAKKLLEKTDATFLPMNRPLYEEVSDRIMDILRTQSDSFEKAGIDEAYLDTTARTNGDFAEGRDLAGKIKGLILQQEHITCSIGVAPNKVVAKIASAHQKPNGLTIVRHEEVNSFLGSLSVGKIPGVGKKAEQKLAELHVTTVSQLASLNPNVLVEAFGKNLGGYIYHAARGDDDDPVQEREQPTQLSRIATLKKNTRDPTEIMAMLDELVNSVALKLTERKMVCRSVSVIAILEDLSIHSKSKTLESATADVNVIKRSARELVQQFLQSMPNAVLRRAGVKVSMLSNQSGQTDISKFLMP
jgi:DNA polymerase IV (DinB-like DNA polymerase)